MCSNSMGVIEMKTQDVIDLALAAGLCQDGDMFFSPTTGDADVHISDLEYFAKTIKDRIISRQKFDMYTKLQSVYTSVKYVQKSDIFTQPKSELDAIDQAYFAGKQDGIAESQWVGLTDDEIEKIVDLNTSDDGGFDIFCDGQSVAYAIINKLKERNT